MDTPSAIPNSDPTYRERKLRTHAVMREALRGAPLVQHDFHQPAAQSQDERDRRFWLACRWAVTGPEPAMARVGEWARVAAASA